MNRSDLKPIRTLFLDAGGVLVNPNWRRVSEALARQGVANRSEELEQAESRAKLELDTPTTVRSSDDRGRGLRLFHRVLELSGIEHSAATEAALEELRDYHAAHNIWESVPSDVPSALEDLRTAGLRLVVVSNANGTVVDLLTRLELLPFFDHVVDSAVEGVEKPDAEIFHIALDRAGSRAEETAHVGDMFEIDVVGARSAGLEAILIDRAGLYVDRDCLRFASLAELTRTMLR